MTKNKNSTVYYNNNNNNKQINNTLKKMSQAPGKDLIRDGNW